MNKSKPPSNGRHGEQTDNSRESRRGKRVEGRNEEHSEPRLWGRARERLRRLREERDARRTTRALDFLGEARTEMVRGMTDYIIRHRQRLRQELLSSENYGLVLQQIDDLFLNKLGALERIGMELDGGQSAGRLEPVAYETLELSAPRKELPQKLKEALSAHADAELLQVLPLSAEGDQVEMLILLARPLPREPQEEPRDDKDDRPADDR